MRPTTRFVHLRVHSEYSLEDSVLSVPALLDEVLQMNMPAVGLADQSNVFAVVKFYREPDRGQCFQLPENVSD